MPRLGWPNLSASIVCAGLALLTGASLATALAGRWWIFSLLTSFSLQFLCLATLLALLALLRGLKLLGLIAALLGGTHLSAATTLFHEQHPIVSVPPPAAVTLRLTTLNLKASNRNYLSVIAYLRREPSDVVILQEVRQSWPRHLSGLSDLYPFTAPKILPPNEDVLVLSRHPIARAERIRVSSMVSLFRVDVEMAGHRLALFPVHLESPKSAAAVVQRTNQLRSLGTLVVAAGVPVIVAGDFNIARWDPELDSFLQSARLVDAADGRGWIPTWPTFFPPVGVPIDRIVVNDRLAVTHVERGPNVGSDHWPLVAQLACCM